MRSNVKKIINYLKTVWGHIFLEIGIIICIIPIYYSDDILLVKGIVTIMFFLFYIHMMTPTTGYEIAFNKFKSYLRKEVKKNESLKYLEDKLARLESEI